MKPKSIKMRVIPDSTIRPGDGTLEPTFKGPAIKGIGEGSGDINYECGSCGLVLIETTTAEQTFALPIKCGGCGAYNVTPGTYNKAN